MTRWSSRLLRTAEYHSKGIKLHDFKERVMRNVFTDKKFKMKNNDGKLKGFIFQKPMRIGLGKKGTKGLSGEERYMRNFKFTIKRR